MHGGRLYEYARMIGGSSDDVLDFSANINPLGPPDSVMGALRSALTSIRAYPDTDHSDVKRVLVEKFKVEPANLVCGNGASEVIDLCIRQVHPNRIWIWEPAFSEYQAAARRCRVPTIHHPIGDIRTIADCAMAPGDMVIINNPHNPTGQCWTRSELSTILALCDRGVSVMVDESFLDFRWDEAQRTMIPLAVNQPNLLVVRSATKVFAIPGLRFGVGIGHPDLIRKIDRDTWSVNQLAQAAAAAAYHDVDFMRATWAWLSQEQDYISNVWGTHPAVRFFSPSVNFFLIELGPGLDVERLTDGFRREGIFVRHCDDFAQLGPRFLRLAIRSHDENERLWHAFARLTNSIG